ncbi:MAG: META domain-containing protein, partial [Steroidobacteraceae bacterium]
MNAGPVHTPARAGRAPLRRRAIPALFTLLLGPLSACATPPASAEPSAATATPVDLATLVGSTWLAEDIDQRGVVDRLQSRLTLEGVDRVRGFAGCNSFRGPAQLAAGSLAFGPFATTRMACAPAVMDQERRFLDALVRARSAAAQHGLLYLYDAAREPILRFSRVEPQ